MEDTCPTLTLIDIATSAVAAALSGLAAMNTGWLVAAPGGVLNASELTAVVAGTAVVGWTAVEPLGDIIRSAGWPSAAKTVLSGVVAAAIMLGWWAGTTHARALGEILH